METDHLRNATNGKFGRKGNFQRYLTKNDKTYSDCLLIICLGDKRKKIELNKFDNKCALFKYKVSIFLLISYDSYPQFFVITSE